MLRSQKTNLKQQKRGEFFAARLAGSISGNSGLLGSPSFGYFSWRDKKSDLPPATPANGQQPREGLTIKAASRQSTVTIFSQNYFTALAITEPYRTPMLMLGFRIA